MKISGLSTLFVIALFLLQSGAFAQKDNKDRIEGSGHVITREIPVKSFDKLDASGVFSLHLSQGNREEVKIEADDNLQDLFTVESDGSTLKIGMKKNADFKSKNKLKVFVTFKNLTSLDLSMVGSTVSDEKLSFKDLAFSNSSVGSVNLSLAASSLHLDNNSVGNLKLSGNAEHAVITSNSVGGIRAGDFLVQVMEIENSGVGSAEVNAEKELKVSDSFLGKVRNKGNATVKRKNKTVI